MRTTLFAVTCIAALAFAPSAALPVQDSHLAPYGTCELAQNEAVSTFAMETEEFDSDFALSQTDGQA